MLEKDSIMLQIVFFCPKAETNFSAPYGLVHRRSI